MPRSFVLGVIVIHIVRSAGLRAMLERDIGRKGMLVKEVEKLLVLRYWSGLYVVS
jgi:hypothetical protein